MTSVHHVKKARKDNEVVKAGEPYYWWKFGPHFPKQLSATPPKAWQLTTSPFLQTLYQIQEDISTAKVTTADDLAELISGWVGQIIELRDETEESLSNMPEGLQEGDTGQLLQERIDGLENWESELDGIDLEPPDDADDDWLEERLEEAQAADAGL